MLANRKLWVAYKIIFIIIATLGLLLTAGVFEGKFELGMFNYYTVQSNCLCLFYFIGALIYNHKNKEVQTFLPQFKGALVMCISVTGLIYHFILLPTMFSMDASSDYNVFALSNIIVHYIVPIMVVLDWLIFDKKGVYKWYSPFTWIIIPYLYFLYAIVRAQLFGSLTPLSRYPYDFIDIDKYGISTILYNVLVLTIFFVVLGYLIFLIDRIIARLNSRENE